MDFYSGMDTIWMVTDLQGGKLLPITPTAAATRRESINKYEGPLRDGFYQQRRRRGDLKCMKYRLAAADREDT